MNVCTIDSKKKWNTLLHYSDVKLEQIGPQPTKGLCWYYNTFNPRPMTLPRDHEVKVIDTGWSTNDGHGVWGNHVTHVFSKSYPSLL